MKPFVFNGVEYMDLNSLGVAFSENFELTLEAIKEKNFVSFVKKFKDYKKNIIELLYSCRYLSSVASLIIYHFTADKILVIGGKKYFSINEVFEDYEENSSIKMFIADKGIRRTIIDTIDDERMKLNILAIEDYYNDEFAVNYLKSYPEYDGIESIDEYVEKIINADDKFKAATTLFNDDTFLMILAHKYSLVEVLKIREKRCRIFEGINLISNADNYQTMQSIFSNVFFSEFANNLNKYKFKTKRSKEVLKLYKKAYKLFTKESTIKNAENLYLNYIKLVDLFVKKELLIKKNNDNFELNVAYCNTYVWNAYADKNFIGFEDNNINVDDILPKYNLKDFRKAIKNHQSFGIWSILFVILFGISCVMLFVNELQGVVEKINVIYYVLGFGGIVVSLVLAIIVLIKNYVDKKRYFVLCRLAYYRNNESILTNKQLLEFKRISLKEDEIGQKIDKGYRIIGAILMTCLSLAIIIGIGGIGLISWLNLSIPNLERMFYSDLLYIIFIPGGVLLVLGLLRRKKTSWSAIFTVILSIAIIGGLLFIL